jgi:hypothetical protein
MMPPIQQDLDEALSQLETLSDEIRVKMHLAGMDAKDAWRALEPRVAEARQHAREATTASKAAIHETLEALRSLQARL